MSNIPKSKRSESKLEALHRAYALRRKITAELMATFGYSQKKLEAHVQKMTAHVPDPEEREKMSKTILDVQDSFDSWFVTCRCAFFCTRPSSTRSTLLGASITRTAASCSPLHAPSACASTTGLLNSRSVKF